jgi:FkbM family methyltransferase
MEILERFKEIISVQDNPFVIEFGACDGFHTRIMLNILNSEKPNYIYHLFEPVKDLIEPLINTLKSNSRVKAFNEAVGSKTGSFIFYQSSGGITKNGVLIDSYYGSSSIRKPKIALQYWKEMRFAETICNTITFDDYLIRENLSDKIIDFIWADIQGAEVDLILGGEKAFKNVRYFYTEYSDVEIYEGEITLEKILELMPNFEIVEDYNGDVLLKNKNI